MTNREWLNTLTNREFIEFVLFELPTIGKVYIDSVIGLSEWLQEKHYD